MVEINGYGTFTTKGLYLVDSSRKDRLVLHYENGLELPLKFKHGNSRSRAYLKLKQVIKNQEEGK